MIQIKELFPLLKAPLTVSCDTRTLQKDNVFVAFPCGQAPLYAKEAFKKGARVIICEPSLAEFLKQEDSTLPLIVVPQARLAFSCLARFIYPSQPNTLIAVTGTNGKSSVVGFIRQLWNLLSLKGASIGTLGLALTEQAHFCLEDFPLPTLTTPDALTLHKLSQTLYAHQIHHLAIEASSHGLDQYRLHGLTVKAAGFTNLTQDHLDYHPSMEEYFKSKMRLFSEILAPEGIAVLNKDSPYFQTLELLIRSKGQEVLSYSVGGQATLEACRVRLESAAVLFDLKYKNKIWSDICLPLVGAFQVENILCAIGLLIATGIAIEELIPLLPNLTSAPGRMELVGKNPNIFIDYAHTPDALSRSLAALRNHMPPQGKLYVVFGCGGNRDTEKRALMGKIAAQQADGVYITDDNPRYEDPAFIRAQILAHCPHAIEIGDRQTAISQAMYNLQPNDSLLIAGKGHEQGQIIGDKYIPFDDKQVVQTILEQA